MADKPNSTEIEEWRDVPGWEGLYQVSSLGRVKSLDRSVLVRQANGNARTVRYKGLVLKQKIASTGYPGVMLTRSKARFSANIHALVCEAFHGPRPSPAHQVAHNDGSRTNNRADNLRWATVSQNCLDKRRHGTMVQGEEMWRATFTEAQIRNVRRRYKTGEGLTSIAKSYGTTATHIKAIVDRRTWKHVL